MPDLRIIDVTQVDGNPVKLGLPEERNNVTEPNGNREIEENGDKPAGYKVSLADLKKFRQELDELSELEKASKHLAKIFVAREVARNVDVQQSRE